MNKKPRIETMAFIKKMALFASILAPLFALGLESFSSRYGIWFDSQEDRCIPEYSYYLVSKKHKNLERGDIGTFKTHKAIKLFAEGSDFGKYVAGVAGDKVDINKNGVFVNNQKVSDHFEPTEKVKANHPNLYRSFVVDDGAYFFIGTGEGSYDSRYWGTVKQEQITGKAWGLW